MEKVTAKEVVSYFILNVLKRPFIEKS